MDGMNNINIGVIGAGVLGSYHIDKCLHNPHVNMAGFYDSEAERRIEISKKFGIRAYDGMEQLIKDVDAVIISVPSSFHHDVACLCLDSGKHVLVEKPLAASYKGGLDIVTRAGEKGLVLHVGHSESYNAAFTRLRSYKPSPRFIEAHRLAFYSHRGTDVSVILDLMVHDLQLVMRLCKEEPVLDKIAATGVSVISSDIDIANVRLVFPSGCVANLTASRISAKRMRKIRIFATGAYFSVDLDKCNIERYAINRDAVPLNGIPLESLKETLEKNDALEAELESFVNAINGNRNGNEVDGTEALKVLKVTDVIMNLISNAKNLNYKE
jgi:predicted dehydrogenase